MAPSIRGYEEILEEIFEEMAYNLILWKPREDKKKRSSTVYVYRGSKTSDWP